MPTAIAAPPRRSRRTRALIAQVVLTLLFALSAIIAISTIFVPDSFEPAAVVLIGSFGCLASVLGISATWTAPDSSCSRLALWALPLFFVWHIAALGTWMPDAALGAVAAVCILLLTPSPERARHGRSDSTP